MKRIGLVAIAVAALATPATSRGAEIQLQTHWKKSVKKFKLSLYANQPAPGGSGQASFYGDLYRKPEYDSYSFYKGVTFTPKADLSKARVKVTFAGGRGKVDMKFTATGKPKPVPPDKGCTGTPGTQRSGVLKGKFKLHADRLGTAKMKKIKARLYTNAVVTQCSGGFSQEAETTFQALSSPQAPNVSVTARKPDDPKKKVDLAVRIARAGNGWEFDYEDEVLTKRSNYTSSADLKSAAINGDGRIAGAATYSGTSTGDDSSTEGTLSGKLTAKLRAIGNVNVLRKGPLPAAQFHFGSGNIVKRAGVR